MSILRKSTAWFAIFALALPLSIGGCAGTDQIKKKRPGEVSRKKRGTYQKGKVGPGGMLKVGNPYKVGGQTYYPIADAYGFSETGIASWYGSKFHGKKTANGETYNMYAMTAAHKTLPMPTMVEVTSLENGRKIVVRVNDRGPFVANRIIDLSKAAAEKIGMVQKGTMKVKIVALAEGQKPTPQAPPEPVMPVPDFNQGEFYVQVGAFSIRQNAERLRERLTRPWRPMRLLSYQTLGGELFTRVQAGPYAAMDEAEVARQALFEEGFGGAFIVAR